MKVLYYIVLLLTIIPLTLILFIGLPFLIIGTVGKVIMLWVARWFKLLETEFKKLERSL